MDSAKLYNGQTLQSPPSAVGSPTQVSRIIGAIEKMNWRLGGRQVFISSFLCLSVCVSSLAISLSAVVHLHLLL